MDRSRIRLKASLSEIWIRSVPISCLYFVEGLTVTQICRVGKALARSILLLRDYSPAKPLLLKPILAMKTQSLQLSNRSSQCVHLRHAAKVRLNVALLESRRSTKGMTMSLLLLEEYLA